MRNPYKLPRKAKKAFKKRDPELYILTHASARLERDTETSIKVGRVNGELTMSIDMAGGTV